MRLIDILNKIANGELKEGTKVKVFNYDFAKSYNYHLVFNEGELRTGNGNIFVCPCKDLNEECELIEPDHFPDVGKMAECEHEWSKYSIGRLGRTENYRRCKKCGIHEEDIEPTDNTKVEELIADEINGKSLAEALSIIGGKVNEVIRYINKGAEK